MRRLRLVLLLGVVLAVLVTAGVLVRSYLAGQTEPASLTLAARRIPGHDLIRPAVAWTIWLQDEQGRVLWERRLTVREACRRTHSWPALPRSGHMLGIAMWETKNRRLPYEQIYYLLPSGRYGWLELTMGLGYPPLLVVHTGARDLFRFAYTEQAGGRLRIENGIAPTSRIEDATWSGQTFRARWPLANKSQFRGLWPYKEPMVEFRIPSVRPDAVRVVTTVLEEGEHEPYVYADDYLGWVMPFKSPEIRLREFSEGTLDGKLVWEPGDEEPQSEPEGGARGGLRPGA